MSLPSGYTELEYIQSSGQQYINTGFTPNQDTRLVIDFEPISVASTHIFGSRTASSGSDAFVTLVTGGVYRDDYYNDKVSTSVAPSGRITIDKNKNVTTVGSASVTHTYTTFSGTYPIALFASNTGGTVSYHSSYKLYSCKIYNNGTLVRNFCPCQNSSGTVGLWDSVNSKFYSDATGAGFTAGPTIADPTAPKDGHNVLIDGAACQIESGTVMIGGTVYEIEKGEVLIGGTVYEIPFAGGTCTVTITGSGKDGLCYVEIGDRSYQSAITVDVENGTVISCGVAAMGQSYGYIYYNGTNVATATSGTKTYQYTVKKDVSIQLKILSGSNQQARYIYIVDT